MARRQLPGGGNPPQVVRGEATVSITRREGPLPDPELLAHYDRVLPGAAPRIMDAFERESAHRHQMDRDILAAQLEDVRAARAEARRGQTLAFAIGTIAIVGGCVVALFGDVAGGIAGGVIGGGGVIGLVAVFIKGRQHPKDDE